MSSGYTRDLVEQLLPAIWDHEYDYGIRQPGAPDPDMPKAQSNPAESNTLYAHLADIRWVWPRVDLTLKERQAVLLRYGFDMTVMDVGFHQECDKSVASRRLERAVGKVTAHLNGGEYIDGYEDAEEAMGVQL